MGEIIRYSSPYKIVNHLNYDNNVQLSNYLSVFLVKKDIQITIIDHSSGAGNYYFLNCSKFTFIQAQVV
jgi:hypothetical protein